MLDSVKEDYCIFYNMYQTWNPPGDGIFLKSRLKEQIPDVCLSVPIKAVDPLLSSSASLFLTSWPLLSDRSSTHGADVPNSWVPYQWSKSESFLNRGQDFPQFWPRSFFIFKNRLHISDSKNHTESITKSGSSCERGYLIGFHSGPVRVGRLEMCFRLLKEYSGGVTHRCHSPCLLPWGAYRELLSCVELVRCPAESGLMVCLASLSPC